MGMNSSKLWKVVELAYYHPWGCKEFGYNLGAEQQLSFSFPHFLTYSHFSSLKQTMASWVFLICIPDTDASASLF